MPEVDAPRAQSASDTGSGSGGAAVRDLGHSVRAVLLAWMIPGAGHVYLGRRRLGSVFCLIVFAALAIGLSLDGNLSQILPERPLSILATLGTMGVGVAYFLLRFVVGYTGDVVASGFEYGSAFILTAGLMNLLLVLDAWDRSAEKE